MGFEQGGAGRAKVVGSAVLVIACALCVPRPVPADPAAPTLQAAIGAWRDSLKTWASYPEELRRERSQAFMSRFDRAQIATMCRECSKDERLGADGAAFLRARFNLLPPTAAELAAMIREVDLGTPCHRVAIQDIARRQDSFAPAEGETLATALIHLADHATYSDDIRLQLELAAAHLSRSDRIFERMRGRIESDDPALQSAGIEMAAQSTDPRTVEMLSTLLDRVGAGADFPPARLLIVCAKKIGPAAYDRILPFHERAGDAELRAKTLDALCFTRDPRAMGDLLHAYGDAQTGIRDETSRIAEPVERLRYERLWSDSRILEPTLIAALRGDDPRLGETALEIADRACRYGRPLDADGLIRALQAFAESPGRRPEIATRAEMTIQCIGRAVTSPAGTIRLE